MGTTDLLATWAALPPRAQWWILFVGAVVISSSLLAQGLNGADRAWRADGHRPGPVFVGVQGFINGAALNWDKVYEAGKRLAELRRLWRGKSPRPTKPAGGGAP